MSEKPVVLAIVGPTAVGKTALSIELAKTFNGEIINGDSMQIYRELSIGTAKITEEEMEGVPHHLLDIKDPNESFSVAEYQKIVREKIEEIAARGKLPIIVGGTGLYIQSVLYDFRFTKQPKLDVDLQKELEKLPPDELFNRLRKLDPEAANEIHPNNVQRVIRAIERVELSGKQKKEIEQDHGQEKVYPHYIIGLTTDREVLYERINKRVDLMVEKGLLEEVKKLHEQGIRGVQSIQAIGYKEIYAYLDGFLTLEEALDNLKQNSRRYAKRQLTYFRNKMDIHWYDPFVDREKIIKEITDFLQDN
ncbi:tRNA (adenosine(37)-N6)-dimethylallyltransferase MiaA [Psychrobacillus lasiicapitis]|uniref:tRNA dimethylallyltransferase n=1 Tax=Psychrobacillus lasiicapitis TaxID=1636719 RepID=A0A544THY9_9BACI|nr:tRNA (adenosine(37)-N6)-dimethylallyltransferase MiaA [Psychrobacillus lasiicapitis]TQR17074.1 tRNA (adenosine(37)-N6)-dimethylallyltransferase MiaA [Psychrobacillus lasiicapitis]GGA24794.1 tRNA dimethylallyltransferase [Psychrobacillus lasiicapitis]